MSTIYENEEAKIMKEIDKFMSEHNYLFSCPKCGLGANVDSDLKCKDDGKKCEAIRII